MIDEMDDIKSVYRTRVNGAVLPKFHGKQVCVLGTIVKADGGSAFQMRCSDGAQITVRLKQPINEPLSGVVEVYGMGQGKSLVIAESFTAFPDEITARFDMSVYNEYVKLLNVKEMEEVSG